jgi:hypothetical protein
VVGGDCTAEKIVDRVQALDAGPDDAIVCYFLGHGAYDPDLGQGEPGRGHFFQLPGGDLLRRTLVEHLLARPGRLKVLVSDSCNVPVRPRVAARPKIAKDGKKDDDEGSRMPSSFERLVRYHSGVVDLNSSSLNQYSWYSNGFGGWFTFAFCRQMNAAPDWPRFMTALAEDSNTFFKQRRTRAVDNLPAGQPLDADLRRLKEQTAMTVSVYQMALAADPPVDEPDRPRFRIRRVPRFVFD